MVVIIYHSNCLHERIANGRAHEFEAPLEKIFAQSIRDRRSGHDRRAALALHWPMIDERPNVIGKRAEFLLHGEKGLRVLHGRVYLEPVPNDAFIREQSCNLPVSVSRDFSRVKPVKCPPIILSLPQNRFPAKTGLCTFEDQKLEKYLIVMLRHAPLLIVILEGEFSTGPRAAFCHEWILEQLVVNLNSAREAGDNRYQFVGFNRLWHMSVVAGKYRPHAILHAGIGSQRDRRNSARVGF